MRDSERVEFEWVFRSTYPSVLRTTYLVLHDRGRAEDVTQDAFLRLYERWRASRRSITRRPGYGGSRSARPSVGPEDATADASPPDDRPSWTGSRTSTWPGRWRRSPPQQRAAVALYYLDDLPVEDVAHHLGVSTSTVKQHLFRARRRLAAMLSETVEVSSDVD